MARDGEARHSPCCRVLGAQQAVLTREDSGSLRPADSASDSQCPRVLRLVLGSSWEGPRRGGGPATRTQEPVGGVASICRCPCFFCLVFPL